MKKRLLALLLAIMAICPLITACSDSYYQYETYLDFINLGDPTKVEIAEADIEYGILAKYYDYFSDEISDKTLASTSHTSGEVKYGDTVNIDYKGYKQGETKPFEGGSTYKDDGTAQGTDLEIGSGSYIDGFETGLVGHEIGETVSLYLTFPETYSSTDLAGKSVRFDVVINKVTKRYPYPEMTDEEIKKQSDGKYETVAAFREEARKEVIKNEIWENFYEMCKIKKWPEQELKDYYYTSLDQHKNTANYFYGNLDSYAKAMGYTDGVTLRAYIMSQARQQCKQDVMVLALVEKYGLKLSDADLEAKMKALHKEAVDEGNFEGSYKEYLKTYDESAVRISVYTDVVMDYLMTKNTIENNLGKNGFYGLPSNGIYYYVNGVKQTGWVTLDLDGDGQTDGTYFFNPELDGRAYHNIAVYMPEDGQTESKYLKFGANGLYKGVANNEIVNDGNGYIYIKDNEKQTGLQLIDRTGEITGEEQYLFDADGYLLLGVQKIEADKLGLEAGALGDYEGKYYNFGTSGIFNFDLETKENGKYGTASNNALAEGIYDSRYYKEGVMQLDTTFTDTENNVYYFDTDGEMAKAKFVELETGKHYFDNSGKMIKGTADKPYELEIDGIIYSINENGVVTSETPAPSEGE